MYDRLGFLVNSSSIRGNIMIPRYYNPEVSARLDAFRETHDLICLGDLVREGKVQVRAGHEIGKMAYGTGTVPFVRTSDIAGWEIRSDPKQGVSRENYEKYSRSQDVRARDILLVKDGTYLVGSVCMVTKADEEMLFQSHILKFRVTPNADISPELLLALLSAPVVQQQIRSKQFTADIIDTIGDRYMELVLPAPKDRGKRHTIEADVREIVETRSALRERFRRLPLYAEGLLASLDESPGSGLSEYELTGNTGFLMPFSQIINNVFVPRYYDPSLKPRLEKLSASHNLTTIGDMEREGIVGLNTGIEIGKMAYDTGPIPFIRTSDMSNGELRADPKQGVSEELYARFKRRTPSQVGDILLVRDGTYLVGNSCILTEADSRLLYCGGLYRIHVRDPKALDPYLLFVLLNTPIVRRQMRAKQFTRDVIDTIGKRIREVVLPVPKDNTLSEEISDEARRTISRRVELREKARATALLIEER